MYYGGRCLHVRRVMDTCPNLCVYDTLSKFCSVSLMLLFMKPEECRDLVHSGMDIWHLTL